MVIKGAARGGPADLAAHLKRTDENERVKLIGIHGLAGRNIDDALAEMDSLGGVARARRTLYHASINVGIDEAMPGENWEASRRALMTARSAENQPYIEVEHEKKGRIHRHIVWLNIDLERGVAISDSHNYRQHEEVARALERQFGHDRVQGAHAERDGKPRPDRTPSYAEMQQAKRTGLDPKQAKAFVTGLWQGADSGKAFAASLDNHGWTLAKGDRRDFVLIDPHGETHSLTRRVDAKAAEVRARMNDIDPASLPSVTEARAMQKAHAADRQQQQHDVTSGKIQEMEPKRDAERDAAATVQQAQDEITKDRKMDSERDDPQPANQNNPENITLAATQEPLQAPMPSAAPSRPEEEPTPSGEAHSPAQTAFAHGAVDDFVEDAQAAVGRAERFGSRLLAGIADRIEAFINFVSDIFAPAPKLTADQAERAVMAAEERAQENADLSVYFNNEAALDRLLDGIRIDDAEVERQERVERSGDNRERDMC